MDYWKRLSFAAAIAVSAGCAAPHRPQAQESNVSKLPNNAGSVYNDIYNFKPLEFEAFSDAGEVDAAIESMRRRLFFAAGPDKAEEIIRRCENDSAKTICPVNETQRVLENINIFNEAVNNCYTGRKFQHGRPDPGSEGQMDLDCFISSVGKIDLVKGVNGMECQRTLYDCYKTGYTGIAKAL